MEANENKKKEITLAILGGLFLLILVIGAAYSYFQVVANNNTSATTITGNSQLVGQATLTTNISSLKLNITAEMMHSSNANTTYYATESGVPVTTPTEGSGIYTLATASLTESEVTVDCSYTYDISATTSKTITDGSDANYKVVITESNGTETAYTLAQIISGVTHTGKINKLAYGTNQTLKIKAYVTNTESIQNDLSGNTIAITITPKSGDSGFSCDITLPTASEKLIASGELWSSGLEGDGYRYTGSGNYDSATTPDNFICFGTSDKTECKNNEAKYLYRIIGVFPDSSNNQHVKLISFKQLTSTTWHSSSKTDTSWGNSSLFTSLNGSGFMTNSTYDYLQNSTWLNKIENWQWSAVNTKTYTDKTNGVDYYETPPKAIYQHEMHKSVTGDCYNYESERSTCTVGEWSTSVAKIGLMYASDYALSLGDTAIAMTTGTGTNASTLKTGWMHQSNNDTSQDTYEWTLSRYGDLDGDFNAWYVSSDGLVGYGYVAGTAGVRPVFHLTSDARINGGNGSYSNPYILE